MCGKRMPHMCRQRMRHISKKRPHSEQHQAPAFRGTAHMPATPFRGSARRKSKKKRELARVDTATARILRLEHRKGRAASKRHDRPHHTPHTRTCTSSTRNITSVQRNTMVSASEADGDVAAKLRRCHRHPTCSRQYVGKKTASRRDTHPRRHTP
jgi:hypothetical protein